MTNSEVGERQEDETVDGSPENDASVHEDEEEEEEGGAPHEALLLVLAHLPLLELLRMSEVCRWLRDAVERDVLLWLDVMVEKPLNVLFSDEIMLKMTSRANGRLRTLALIGCTKITDDGLQQVIEKNPHINKLYLPGCTALTPEGIIRAVKTLTERHQALRCVKMNGIYNLTKDHLQTLGSYLQMNLICRNPEFHRFHDYRKFSPLWVEEGDRAIDVEVCPRCNEVRMVFDCPRDTCTKKRENATTECRGCYFCIPRCEECGKCVEDDEGGPGEVVCADFVCSDCWLQLPKCNLCNRPYCRRHHAIMLLNPGFTCGSCLEVSLWDTGNSI